jgi:hypothetical protein
MEISAETLAEALRILQSPTKKEQADFMKREPGREQRSVACVSPTGAKFDAIIGASEKYPDFGRVVRLENYQYPENPFPRSMQPYALNPIGGAVTQELTVEAKQYLYEHTLKADLRAYVGKEFDWMIRADKQSEINTLREKMNADMAAAIAAKAPPEAEAPKGRAEKTK